MKAVRPKPGGPIEVYNLASDPGEAKDLAGSRPELAAEFEKRLKEARTVPRQQKEPPHPWWEARS
jgi:hypothetical protein